MTVCMRIVNYIFFTICLIALAYVSTVSAEQVRIGIVDSGYTYTGMAHPNFCKTGSIDLTTGKREVGSDSSVHGSIIIDIIANFLNKNNIDYCIVLVKFDVEDDSQLYAALRQLSVAKVSYINLSYTSDQWSYTDLKTVSDMKNVLFFAAAGNDNLNMNEVCNSFPSCYKLSNVKVVGALDMYRNRSFYSNYGGIVEMWDIGDFFHPIFLKPFKGTSFATPRALARYVKEKHGKTKN